MRHALLAAATVAAVAFSVPGLAAVGRTPGAADVSTAGAAHYSIGLALPSGTRGLTPQLALTYSSRSGRGLLGVGWDIAGVSVITRCNRTVAQDGAARGVRNDASDVFCLDGNRLRLISGTYGSPSSVYHTEIETYGRITANGTAGNGPASFQVYGKDGLIYDYGATTDSRIESVGQPTVRAWALNRISDRQGNYIAFVYGEDTVNGGFRLEEVNYTGSSGVSPPYQVDFKYGNRVDVDIEYIAGSKVQELNRLTSIDVTYQLGLIHRYILSYDVSPSTGRDRLTSVQECAGAVPDCLPATTFAYQEGSIGLQAEQSTTITSVNSALVLDVNGDGRDDLVYSSTGTSGTGKWMVAFAATSGGYATPVNTNITNTNYTKAIAGDYNSDGKADLLVPYSGSTWWVLLGTATGLATPVNTGTPTTTSGTGANAAMLDVDADGRVDLVWADITGTWSGDAVRYRAGLLGGGFSSTITTLIGPYNGPFEKKIDGVSWGTYRKRLDFNGDARQDFVIQSVERSDNTLVAPDAPVETTAADAQAAAAVTYTYIYFMDAWCPGVGYCWSGVTSTVAAGAPVFGDFNGDGKTDALWYDSSNYYRYKFSTGTGSTSPQSGPHLSSGTWSTVIDWDGDGFDDMLAAVSGTWRLLRSNGVAFEAPVNTGLSYPTPATMTQAMDLTGDGLEDIGYYQYSAGTWAYRTHTLDNAAPDLLVTAQDGFGSKATFSYLPITHSTVYTKGTGTTFPATDVQAGFWLVRQLSQTDGTGGTTETARTYSYEAGRRDLQGRGFLGFARRTTVDDALGYNLKTLETFAQDFPKIGALLSSELQQSNGTRIRYTANTWSSLPYLTGYSSYWYPYVSSRSIDQHEVGGLYNGTKVRNVTTTVAAVGGIDSTSGLIQDVTTRTTEVATGLVSGSYKDERTQHTAVLNDTTNWCIGHPTASQQTNSHTLNNGAAVTRTSDASWDAVHCRPNQVRQEPGNGALQVTVDLGYDGFGNLTSQIVTGVGMAARLTTTSWGTSGRFPVSVTNALNQTTNQGWNTSLGLPSSVTDPNGLATSWTYDEFGRRTGETRPDATSTAWTYAACGGGCDAKIKWQVTEERKDTAGQTVHTEVTYLDRWDRPIWQKVQLLTANDYTWAVRREYDARGALSRDYAPYLTSGSDHGYRQLTYDALGRMTADALYRAGGALDRSTGYAYSGLAVTQTDPLAHQTTRMAAAWGPLLRVTDAANGQMNFQYDAFDLLKQALDPANNVVTQVTYNARGMRTQSVDMDLGTWSYAPNALGEVTSQTDAKNQTTTFTYDLLGRPATRFDPGYGTSTWTWGAASDNTPNNKYVGRLSNVTGLGYSESFVYDGLGRPQTRTITSDASYVFDYAYNALGLLDTLTYPTSTASARFKAKYGYTAGYLSSVQEYTGNVAGTVLWNLNLLDAQGHATSESYGNGLWLQNTFDTLTGLPLTRQSGTGGSPSNVQNLSYAWDTSDNLQSRQDLRQGLTESFTYDALDRLTLASGPASLSINYDAIGNITARSDLVGSYTYDATRKHAVVSAGSNSYGYDANGNLSTRNGASISWTSFNLPTSINDPNSFQAQFDYAPDRSRWRQVSTYAGATETTIYLGGLLEKFTNAAGTHWKHLIPTPSGQVQVIRRSTGANETFYVATDHLGSTDVVMNAAGAVLARPSFAAYGTRRNATTWNGGPAPAEWQAIADTTRRGFTGHEHLDNVMLVHMNGRVFDPVIGRFTAADPYVDGVASTQGWNRFSYVQGQALSATDPSGFLHGRVAKKRLDEAPPTGNMEIVNGVETVTVTGSRSGGYTPPPIVIFSGVSFAYVTTTAIGPGAGEGGGGDNSTNHSKSEPQSPKPDLCGALTDIASTSDANPFLNGSSFDKSNLGDEVVPPGGGPIDNSHFLEPRNGLEYDVQWIQVGWSLTKTYGRNIPQQFGVGYMVLGAGSVALAKRDASFFKNGNVGADMRGLQLGEFGAGNFKTFKGFVGNLCRAPK